LPRGGSHRCPCSTAHGLADSFLDRWYEMNKVVHSIVTRMNGSISAEHGIGTLKRDLLPAVKDAVAMDVMRAIKKALDPRGILNPGKVL
jgi:FAD/FMN-containing dehydrogenase